jgi:hypothetical protein
MEKRTRDRSQGMRGKWGDQHAHPDRDLESWTLMFDMYLEAGKKKVAGLGRRIQRILVSGLGGSR